MSETDDTNLFDMATEMQSEVSERLGDPDEGVDVMTLSGPVGRHTYIGRGAPLEYQVKPALMEAISETVDERVFVDDPADPQEVQERLESQLRDFMDPFQAEHLAQQTAETLANWSDYHGQEVQADE